jgi:hypothetical protein
MNSRCALAFLVVAAVTSAADRGLAQATTTWSIPSRSYHLDFAPDDPERRAVFLDEGLAFEITLDFLMVKHKRVSVEAALPEPGRFEVEQTNPQALVDVTKAGARKVEVVAKIAPMSASDARKAASDTIKEMGKPIAKKIRPEADKLDKPQLRKFLREQGQGVMDLLEREQDVEPLRKAYVDVRTVQQLAPEIRRKLEDLAAKRPKWVPDKDRRAWEKNDPRKLFDDYARLLPYEVLDEYLHRCGLEFDSNVGRFDRELETRARAVYLVLSGEAGWYSGDADEALKALSKVDRDALLAALGVRLRCRFVPDVDPKDPNALWCDAQRLAGRAQGVRSIRVEGKLDPGKHDRVDWWFVEKYESGATPSIAREGRGFRVDPPYPCEGGARLRVVATGAAGADYTLEFPSSTASPTDQEVVIHESPSSADLEFPF